jgi:hypothetical protein
MDTRYVSTRDLWDRYLATRSSECRAALVERYMPMVQMQTALWTYGLGAERAGTSQAGSFDGMSEPAGEAFFLPFVPPDIWLHPAH